MSGPRGGGRTHIVLLHREGFYQLKLPSDDFGWLFGKWSQEMDLNHRHLGYEPNILPLNYPGILFVENGGDCRVRTGDILLAKQTLYQLS